MALGWMDEHERDEETRGPTITLPTPGTVLTSADGQLRLQVQDFPSGQLWVTRVMPGQLGLFDPPQPVNLGMAGLHRLAGGHALGWVGRIGDRSFFIGADHSIQLL